MTATQVVAAQAASGRAVSKQENLPRLRMTQRGRVVLATIIVAPLAAFLLAAVLNGGIATASSDASTESFEYVTVQSGQSLWEVAETIAPTADPREVISDMVRLNQLANSELHPGDRLAIPTKYAG